jgi:hypothetical protein
MITKINLFDRNGIWKSPVSGHQFIPKHIEYVMDKMDFAGISVFTDRHIMTNTAASVKSKYKVAWILEPKIVLAPVYRDIRKHEGVYDLILTHDAELLKKNPKKYVCVPTGQTWIPFEHHKIYDKTKGVSTVMSKKNQFPGHKLRQNVYTRFKDTKKIDFYGNKFKFIMTKTEAIKDYFFSIAIENSSVPHYFTEKIIDCFLCGAVPVYFGATNIGSYFNPNGIIQFKNLNELEKILPTLTKEKYNIMLPAIKENFEKAKPYSIMIDWIHENIFKNMVK